MLVEGPLTRVVLSALHAPMFTKRVRSAANLVRFKYGLKIAYG